MPSKVNVELVSVKISHDGNEYEVPLEQVDFSGYSDECELCGSHGERNMDVVCPCSKTHKICLDSW